MVVVGQPQSDRNSATPYRLTVPPHRFSVSQSPGGAPRILSYATEQFGQADLERASDLLEVHQRDVSLAALYRAHVGAVQPATVGELLLRESYLLPSFSDCPAKSSTNVFHRLPIPIVPSPQPMRLQTMSSTFSLARLEG